MDTRRINESLYCASEHKVATHAMKVSVTTDEYEIKGYIHIKPGGYQSRISDVLNAKDQKYVCLTEVTYRSLGHDEELVRQVDTLIVRLDTIKMVVPQEGEDEYYARCQPCHPNMAEAGQS